MRTGLASATRSTQRFVTASVNYNGDMAQRPRFYANDHSRDVLNLVSHEVRIEDVRTRAEPPSLSREGFMLHRHVSAVTDFRDPKQIADRYTPEVLELISQLTHADRVVILGAGTLRFAERSPEAGGRDNSHVARFIHVDITNATAATFAETFRPSDLRSPPRRYAFYNIWRVLSAPPQDVPLAVCDARTLSPADLMAADAVFDSKTQPEWSFEAHVVRYNPAHRWAYFSGMHSEEALVFKTNDSDASEPSQVPHTAFNDPACPPDVPPRASIEMRAIAYWLD